MYRGRHTVVAILMFAALGALAVQAQEHAHTVSLPDSLKWVEPAALPRASMAIVQGNPGKDGLFVYRLRMPAGYRIPPHLHRASENVTVLSGVFFIGLGEKFDQGKGQQLPAGGFASVPPNHPHYAWVGGAETVVQVHGMGPTDLRFVNLEDDPRKKK